MRKTLSMAAPDLTAPPIPAHTEPTWFLDSESDEVRDFATAACLQLSDEQLEDPTSIAVALFHKVRDGIRYNPYVLTHSAEDFRASTVAGTDENWCTPKAVLLTAAARHMNIPARLGFADVMNHLTTEKLSAQMGTDVFAWHGYSELWLGERWFKVSSAFNIEMCERFGVKTLDFDGTEDALMHPFDAEGRKHMEYVIQRGSFDDLPLEEILATFRQIYPGWSTVLDTDDDAFSPSKPAADDE